MQVEFTRMYRVREVAGLFEVSVATIYRAIESGQLDALKLGTGRGTLRVTGTAVLAYAQACAEAAADPFGTGSAAGVGAGDDGRVRQESWRLAEDQAERAGRLPEGVVAC